MSSLSRIVQYTDRYLRIREIGDWENALNGLQIENAGRVTKIGAAVDISTRVLTAAAKQDVDLLLVHHGLFWPGLQTVTGAFHRQLKLALENRIAVYSAHLPLDVHPIVGNNAQLAATLGLRSTTPFLEEKGQLIGLKARTSVSRDELVRKLEKSLGGKIRAFKFGPKKTETTGHTFVEEIFAPVALHRLPNRPLTREVFTFGNSETLFFVRRWQRRKIDK